MLFKKEQFEVLKVKDFKHFIIGRFLYIAALRMVFTAIGFLVYEMTKSKFQLGLIGLSEVIPAIALALYAGIVVDKSNKRKLILQAEFCYLLSSIFLFGIVYLFQYQHLSKEVTVFLFLSNMFIGGVIRAFNGPAQNAIIAQLVPKEQLVAASTLSSIIWLTAAVAGPLLSGLLLAYCTVLVVFAVVVVLVALSIYFKYKIAPTEVLVKKDIKNWAAIKEGLKFVFHTKVVLGALSLDLFAVLFGGAVALLPVYAKDILKVDTLALGWLNSAEYIGSFIILILLMIAPIKKRQGIKLLWAVAGFGCCTILFAISTNFWFSMLALIAIGLFDGVSVVIRGNIVQLYTPDEMRGRVSSVNSMFINSSNEIGQFESGMAASIMTTVPSVVFGGCVTLLVVFIVWIKAPSLRKLQY
jgi:MFS family permease